MSSTKFVFFGPIGKTRWPPWPLIGWDIFDFSSEIAKWNSMKLDRKQDLNVFYQVCVFQIERRNKMAALASDWPRHFRLLLWNCWTEFNETWQEARSQCPLLSLCFSGGSEKQDVRPGLWLAETFSTSPLKPLNRIQRNLTRSKISTSSTKYVFFGPISKQKPRHYIAEISLNVTLNHKQQRKQKCPPWPIHQKDGTLYSGARCGPLGLLFFGGTTEAKRHVGITLSVVNLSVQLNWSHCWKRSVIQQLLIPIIKSMP